ncbi:hypothetical protein PISMIDRAFT_681619 [Pisolithus microcarpus 441]|uniref:Uncharacterized protein n=1 Tax=Pisolithus microcarpus 441 TaxID=765257 RepID=A0A0C9ZFI0_9AGAM|nr:hypothetical protein PISMIDRAFT_681619 [Pisolithus microcarpus 441]
MNSLHAQSPGQPFSSYNLTFVCKGDCAINRATSASLIAGMHLSSSPASSPTLDFRG